MGATLSSDIASKSYESSSIGSSSLNDDSKSKTQALAAASQDACHRVA